MPDFDDGRWWRDTGPFLGDYGWGPAHAGQPQTVALLCLRGKFGIADPARAGDLRLSLRFRGGAVVHLNGREIGRSHMHEGKTEPWTPALEYPEEAFFSERDTWKLQKDQVAARFETRVRSAEFALPPSLLRKGANVLAIEIHRAPLKPLPPRWDSRNMFNFNTCGLVRVSLTAPQHAAAATIPNTTRPKGFQVWNANLLDLVTPVDYGDPWETIRPIRIVGARGGTFSGQVVAGSDAPIKGLRAEVSDLRAAGGKSLIPASNVCVRYPRLAQMGTSYRFLHPRYPTKGEWYDGRWGMWLPNFDVLSDAPPDPVEVYRDGNARADWPAVWGAVQPVWVTVSVPRDAAPGEYSGRLTVRSEGAGYVEVPISLRVCPWKVPDPRTFSTVVDLAQSPESLAMYYDVPLWSDRHFELIGESLRLMGLMGNDVLYIPMIGETHFGNEHTMARWSKGPDGAWKPDISLVERYLDLAEKHMGRPAFVCFHIWDYHLGGDIRFGRMYAGKRGTSTEAAVPGILASTTDSPPRTERLPHYLSPEGKDVWRKLGEAMSALVRKRSLVQAATLGVGGDILPSKEVVEYWKDIFPESKWMIQGHGGGGHGSVAEVPADLYGVPVNYVSIVYGARFNFGDPEKTRMYGWKPVAGPVRTLFARGLSMSGDVAPPAASRLIAEWNVEGGQRGIGRLMADFFRIPRKDGKGAIWLPGRYPKSSWANAGFRGQALLAPGPAGPIPTVRYELLREGIQEVEARILIEKVLTNEALRSAMDGKLADACQVALDERTRVNMWILEYGQVIDYNVGAWHSMMGGAMDINWYAYSGWEDRAARLFDLAADVEVKIPSRNPPDGKGDSLDPKTPRPGFSDGL
ncbi:MAG: DUF4091 domain-containing protein [Planctomycetota bacterium]|nr:DUF4091 domain-containing protein [Planctomycetota bacterium]